MCGICGLVGRADELLVKEMSNLIAHRGPDGSGVIALSQEGTLPEEVIWRKKAEFTAPVRSWLVGDLRPAVEELLSPSRVSMRGLFEPKVVQALVRDNYNAHEDNALRIWALLTFEIWQETFIDPPGASAISGLNGATR